MKVDILCMGRLKQGPQQELVQDYLRRMAWPIAVHEYESKKTDASLRQIDEDRRIREWRTAHATFWVLDERGQSLSSSEMAGRISTLQQNGTPHLQIAIGGADGLLDPLRREANLLLSFGRMTWPHQLVRVMVVEQLYRSQQILANHPYHRDG
ncbi:MAG: 23S rRNA (pseudouridine(1915)-N(3))-methyltransferase RlmH [Pseudomonadota bacterium]